MDSETAAEGTNDVEIHSELVKLQKQMRKLLSDQSKLDSAVRDLSQRIEKTVPANVRFKYSGWDILYTLIGLLFFVALPMYLLRSTYLLLTRTKCDFKSATDFEDALNAAATLLTILFFTVLAGLIQVVGWFFTRRRPTETVDAIDDSESSVELLEKE